MEIRGILSKVDGVIRVHPYGANGRVRVYVTRKGAITKKSVEKLLSEHKKFRVRKFKKI